MTFIYPIAQRLEACGDDEQLLDRLKLMLEQDRSDHEILSRQAVVILREGFGQDFHGDFATGVR